MNPWLSYALALALVLLELGLRAWKIRLLVDSSKQMPLRRALAVNAYGDAAAAVTPGRLGGDPARFLGLGRCGIEPAASVVGLGAEKLIDMIVLVVVGVALVAAFGERGMAGVLQTAARLGTVYAAVVLAVLCVLMALGTWAIVWYRRRHPGEAGHPLKSLWKHARALSVRTLLCAGLLATVGIAARVLVLPLLCLPFASQVDFGLVVLGSFALLYSQLVLPTPAGVGGIELGFALGFASTLRTADVAALLLTWRLYTLFIPAGLGGVLLARTVVARRTVRAAGIAALLTIAGPTSAAAQEVLGSRNLTVDHWAYEYIERLRPRGYLANLNPLVQPYRRLEVARGLAGLNPDTLRSPVSGWVRMLQQEFARELERLEGREAPHWGIELAAGTRGSTSQRLDALRPTGDADMWPWYRAGGWIERGPVAVETRLLGDTYLTDDPDGADPGQRRGGRSDNAYLSVVTRSVAVTLGRLKRNWSALGTKSLMVSDVATSYPQVGIDLRMGRISLRSFTGELDTLGGMKRYVSGHRLDFSSHDLAVSLGEAVLYAGQDAGMQIRYLNPLEILFFDAENEPADRTLNLMLNLQFWYRIGAFVAYGEGLLDDLDIAPSQDVDPAPTRYAFTLGVRSIPTSAPVALSLQYQQVSSFAYRTSRGADHYSFLRRGLGANYADFDRLSAEVEFFPPVQGLWLAPVLQLQRRGEGDFRTPFPPYDEFRASPALFLGVRETTFRAGLRGRYQPNRHFWLGWDLGENFVRNALHVAGESVTEFTAVAEIGGTVGLPLRRH
jgi:uncharacterized membrane protein YbhN (UPF0104 family)